MQHLSHTDTTEVLVPQKCYVFFSLVLVTTDVQFAFLTSGEYWAHLPYIQVQVSHLTDWNKAFKPSKCMYKEL